MKKTWLPLAGLPHNDWKITLGILLHGSGNGGVVFCAHAHVYAGSESASADMGGNTAGYCCSVCLISRPTYTSNLLSTMSHESSKNWDLFSPKVA